MKKDEKIVDGENILSPIEATQLIKEEAQASVEKAINILKVDRLDECIILYKEWGQIKEYIAKDIEKGTLTETMAKDYIASISNIKKGADKINEEEAEYINGANKLKDAFIKEHEVEEKVLRSVPDDMKGLLFMIWGLGGIIVLLMIVATAITLGEGERVSDLRWLSLIIFSGLLIVGTRMIVKDTTWHKPIKRIGAVGVCLAGVGYMILQVIN